MEHTTYKYFYSRQRNHETRGQNRKQCYTIKYKDEEELKRKIEECKAIQKKLNDEYQVPSLSCSIYILVFFIPL